MSFLHLLAFTWLLLAKNLRSWATIGWGLASRPLMVVLLVLALSSSVGGVVLSYHRYQELVGQRLQLEAELLAQQRFWQRLAPLAPGHRQVIEAQKTLAE